MSEERAIRINKVLKELNISLDRAVDFLKGKGFDVEASLNAKISQGEYSVLCKQFSADKGKKEASIEVSEEKKKEKEALKVERDRELEEKRKQEEAIRIKQEEANRIKREQEAAVIKAKAEEVVSIKTVGKIDLEPKKTTIATDDKKPEVKEVENTKKEEQEVVSKPSTISEKADKASDKAEVKAKTIVTNTNKQVESKKEVEKPKQKVEAVTEKDEKSSSKNESIKEDKGQVMKEGSNEEPKGEEIIRTNYQKLSGTTFTGQTIDLSQFEKPKKKKEDKKGNNSNAGGANAGNKAGAPNANKNKRKRIAKPNGEGNATGGNGTNKPGTPNANGGNANNNRGGNNQNNANKGGGNNKFGNNRNQKRNAAPIVKAEPTDEEVKNQIKETLERLQGKGNKSKSAKYRRDKRDVHRKKTDDEQKALEAGSKILKVTEFVTVGEIATMMDVPITKVIGTCMSLGIMVTMNQRLDAETLTIVADEFGYEVDFTTAAIEEAIEEAPDRPEDLAPRAPIVTVMGHVDHGKTSLLDYIRKANVIAGESGGITQHIGAYGVTLEGGQKITFLDTPGHEAFTAMRARGAQVTDIVIIVIAADDDIMPQTKEAISHAQAAGVPIIFAINKIDKPTANPDKIKEKLASMNLLVEEWGGTYQSQDISAKQGINMNELLEKVLLEAEMLELKANPNKAAVGTVVEAFLDKGRGYVSTVLVQSGTLRVGDYLLAGCNHGKVRAMHDERGKAIKVAGPSTPISVLGLDGAPTAGDKFNVFEEEKEAKQIAAKRTQLIREQSVRAQRHITLAEIGRRIALGDFKELNIILKGDVDGSVEALSDSFSKLSTEEIQINIIHKGVGAITESDVLLASASDAIIIGFNVRPMASAKQLADKEEIDIRNYSIIYAAIDDLKDAMEGMLSPELKEEVTGTAEIRELFKISKVGTIAGCMVTDGKIFRSSRIRLIREGVVIYTGELTALKRFKDDVKEVSKGYDCGIQIKNYNDIKEYDVIEAFQEVEVKKKLK